MKEIMKCLLKYKWKILIVLVLLVVQAYCDLALPEFTSKIVNVGLQQSGIENITPIAMSETLFNNLKEYMSLEEKHTFESAYTLIRVNDQKYLKEYSILSKEKVYLFTGSESLDNILHKPLLMSAFSNPDSRYESIRGYEMNDSLSKSVLINYIKQEYTSIGMDTNKIQMNYIYKTGIKMIIIALLAMGITIINVILSSKIAASFARDLRQKLAEKTMDFEMQDLQQFSTASLITRCTNDIIQIQGLITVFLRIIIFAPIIGIGAITKVSGSNLSWVIIVSVLAILSLMLILFLVVVPKFKKFQELLDKLNLVSRENLNGLAVIRAFANEKEEEKRFDKANSDLTKNGLFVNRAMSIMMPTLTFLMNSVAILIIWAGSKEVNSFSMQVGDLIAFISYTMQIIMSFLMMSMVAIMLPRAIVSLKRISEIFNTKKSVTDGKKKRLDRIDYLEFKDVYFRYPNAEEDVLRNINFKAKKGEVTAFIGSTGSGKSTLINLIPRFYDVTSGKIVINGENIQDYEVKTLRSKISYIPQKGKLFKGSVMYNLTFGQKKKDTNKAKEAARISQALDFIKDDEKGFDKEISEKASNVSGGQKQRLSIAMALSKDADIYIFDDCFSALDFKTDALLRKELKTVMKDKIMLIVAQRISSVMNADQIVVLNEGEIVATGKHEELLKNSNIYREIKESQLGKEAN